MDAETKNSIANAFYETMNDEGIGSSLLERLLSKFMARLAADQQAAKPNSGDSYRCALCGAVWATCTCSGTLSFPDFGQLDPLRGFYMKCEKCYGSGRMVRFVGDKVKDRPRYTNLETFVDDCDLCNGTGATLNKAAETQSTAVKIDEYGERWVWVYDRWRPEYPVDSFS